MLSNFLKSNLLKSAGVYTVFNIAERAVPFLIIPIITRLVSVEEVGYYTLYQAIFNILVPLITLSIGSSVLLNFYKMNYEKFKIYFANGIMLFCVFCLISISIILFLSSEIAEILEFPAFWLKIAFIIVIFQFFTSLRKYLWQAKRRAFNFGIFSLSLTILKNVSGLSLIYFYNYGWEGIVIGHLFGESLFALWALLSFYREKLLILKINKSYLKDLILVGAPLSLHSIGAWLSNSVNRIIISSIIGKIAVGSYGVGATFGIIITLVQVAFNKAYVPYLFDKLKDNNISVKSTLVQITYLYYLLILLFAAALSVIGYYFVDNIFGDAYTETKSFIIPLIFAAAINGMYKMHVNYIFFLKRTFMITKITLGSGILNIFISYIMVQEFGLLGAAYSALFIQLLTYIITFYVGNNLYPMPWFNFRKLKNASFLKSN